MRGITKSEDMKMKINKQNMTFREGSFLETGGNSKCPGYIIHTVKNSKK